MGVPHLDSGPMRAEEFFAFTARRPDDEKWELIEGEPVLNASASRLHQKIIGNVFFALSEISRQRNPGWEIIPGIGVRLSELSVPVPDLLIRPDDNLEGVECNDMIIAFEVLSPSTANKDLRWKGKPMRRCHRSDSMWSSRRTRLKSSPSIAPTSSRNAASKRRRACSTCPLSARA